MEKTLAGAAEEFVQGLRRVLQVGELEVGVFAVDGELFAFENRCPHRGGPVCEGVVVGRVVQPLGQDGVVLPRLFSDEVMHLVCPWHGSEFDLRSGVSVVNPGWRLRRFEVSVRDGLVFVGAEKGFES